MRHQGIVIGLLLAVLGMFGGPTAEASQALRIECKDRGIYRITASDIREAGLNPEDFKPSEMVLANKDASVPIFVKSRFFRPFSDEDYILFFAEGAAEDTMPFVNIYEDFYPAVEIFMLYPNHPTFEPLRIEEENMRSPSRLDDGYKKITVGGRAHYEEDPLWEFYPGFRAASNKSRLDFIFWEKISYPPSTASRDSVTLRFTLADLEANSPGRIKIRLFGAGEGINRNSAKLHRVQINLNGKYRQDVEWPYYLHDAELEVPEGVLASGMNELQVKILKPSVNRAGVGTAGLDLNFVLIDWFDVKYKQQSVVKSEYNEFYLEPDAVQGERLEFLVDGFREQDIVAMNLTARELYRPKAFGTDDRGRFHGVNMRLDNEPAHVVVASGRRLQKPMKMNPVPLTNYFDKGDDCELLILAHPNFMDGMQRFVESKRSQGLKTSLVDITNLFTERTGGYPTVESMHEYVKHVYESQPKDARKLKYLLLVGDSASIAKYQSFLPAYAYLHSGTHASDNYFVAFDRPEGIADIAVGRFSVRNEEQLKNAVDKVIAYENGEHYGPWRANFLVIAASLQWATNDSREIIDKYSMPDFTHRFISTADQKMSSNFYDKLTNNLVDAFNEGGLMSIFFGHGGGTVWEVGPTFERSGFTRHLFDQTNVETLKNGFKNSLVFALTCYTNDFDNPNVNQTLGETFINSEGGAIAVIGSTDRSQVSTNMKFIRTCLDYMLRHENVRLGDMFVHGKREMRLASVQTRYLMLGDPSLRFEMPRRTVRLSNAQRISHNTGVRFDYKFENAVKTPVEATCLLFDKQNNKLGEWTTTLESAEGSVEVPFALGANKDKIRMLFYAIDGERHDYARGTMIPAAEATNTASAAAGAPATP